MLAIAKRTGTDPSRVTLAVIATAIGRATGVQPLTIKVMVNNRFRPGLADVIAPIAQNSVVTFDVTDTTVDEVVARARGASLTAGMRAYYDPDELREVTARLDAERGYPATVTCRVNDQRAMIMRAEAAAGPGEVTPEQVARRLAETSLTWLGRRDNMHEQANILVENRPDVVSLHMMWDRWCLTDEQVEALLRGVEEVALEAAFDPAAPGQGRLASTLEGGQAQIAQAGIVVAGHQQARVARVAGQLVDEPPPDPGGRLAGRHHPHPPGGGRGPYRGECVTEHQRHLAVAGRQFGEISGGEAGHGAGRDAGMLAHAGDPGRRFCAVVRRAWRRPGAAMAPVPGSRTGGPPARRRSAAPAGSRRDEAYSRAMRRPLKAAAEPWSQMANAIGAPGVT